MKKKRHTPEEIIKKLREAEGLIAERQIYILTQIQYLHWATGSGRAGKSGIHARVIKIGEFFLPLERTLAVLRTEIQSFGGRKTQECELLPCQHCAPNR